MKPEQPEQPSFAQLMAENILRGMHENSVLAGEQRVRMLDFMRQFTEPEEHQLLTKHSNQELAVMVANVLITSMNEGNEKVALEILRILISPTQEYDEKMKRIEQSELRPLTRVQRFLEKIRGQFGN